ncbi:hypothetical protein F9B16_09105 [Actinomadura montaniterrae]|uniref:Uncharacterized protein n=1 Tax=Actinomadura montaniterrae TaxID=1803903 RepID=A0A6L3VXN2_9ACTN|nr:hypothetical protein F9B16_09105 [Actinomadura montaniterrae]
MPEPLGPGLAVGWMPVPGPVRPGPVVGWLPGPGPGPGPVGPGPVAPWGPAPLPRRKLFGSRIRHDSHSKTLKLSALERRRHHDDLAKALPPPPFGPVPMPVHLVQIPAP